MVRRRRSSACPASRQRPSRRWASLAALFEACLQELKDDLRARKERRLRWFCPQLRVKKDKGSKEIAAELHLAEFCPQLRVKKGKGAEGLHEMTWARDGRAMFARGLE